jgi:succinate dehydrogenase/fumarate reductase flavoprotein subunit
MSWILVDREGRRFGNEYEPYMQDTGHRAMEAFDPVTQSFSRVPALLIVDAAGRALYPLAAPTWHDAEVAKTFGDATPASLDAIILRSFDSIADLARAFGRDPAVLQATVDDWNLACLSGTDETFGRPPSSMMPIASPPFSAAEIWPIVSNTQGGPVHDGAQRVLDAFGAPIQNLFAAGELGSVFGHLYMSGGNIAECFVGGAIAGKRAAQVANGMPERRRSVAG